MEYFFFCSLKQSFSQNSVLFNTEAVLYIEYFLFNILVIKTHRPFQNSVMSNTENQFPVTRCLSRDVP